MGFVSQSYSKKKQIGSIKEFYFVKKQYKINSLTNVYKQVQLLLGFLFQTKNGFDCRLGVIFGKRKIRQKNVPTLVNPHVFSGRKGLLEQERWEAEGACGRGGRKHEDGGGSASLLSAAATLRSQTMLGSRQRNELSKRALKK